MTLCGALAIGSALVLLALASVAAADAGDAQRFRVEIEFGPAWQSRNDVRIPNATGTEFSLIDLLGTGPFTAGRVHLDWSLSPRSEIRLLVAPFARTGTGEFASPVRFAGQEFAAGQAIEGAYRFNSYRATYRYRLHDGERWTWRIGGTAKIRQARIALQSGATAAEDTDVGFVPLAHVDGEYRFAPRWTLQFDLDGLAAPQGRAFDAALKIWRDVAADWSVSAGYRMLEGGADVDAVYTFAWLHYAVASLACRF